VPPMGIPIPPIYAGSGAVPLIRPVPQKTGRRKAQAAGALGSCKVG